MEDIELFYHKIPQEDKETDSVIPYFVHYCEEKSSAATPVLVKSCYENLSLKPYSNIASYMSSKSKGKSPVFLKNKNGTYRLSRKMKEEIASKLNEVVQLPVTDNLIPMSIFDNTRQYIVSIAEQMCKCYDYGLYDACLVMMRKLLEALIIECFERYDAPDEIKKDGHYLFLSDLIPAFINSKHWTVGKNITNNITKIKKWGDISAHTRHLIAKRVYIDDFKTELRIILEGIVLLIDYPNWHLTKKVTTVV